LTPFIPYEEDIVNWHKSAKDLLNRTTPAFTVNLRKIAITTSILFTEKKEGGLEGFFSTIYLILRTCMKEYRFLQISLHVMLIHI